MAAAAQGSVSAQLGDARADVESSFIAGANLPAWLPQALAGGLGSSKAGSFLRPVSASRLLADVVHKRGCSLLIDGQTESPLFLFDPRVLLPVVAIQAHFRARSLLGFPFGAVFDQDPEALLGVGVSMPSLDGSGAGTCRAAFLVDAAERIFGLQPNSRIECMPVINLYTQGLMAQPEGGAEWPIARTLGPR